MTILATPLTADTSPSRARARRWAAPVIAVAAFAVALSGNGRATLNGDELATLSAARRSLPELWTLAQHIDGHFLPYYAFMHLWASLGTSEVWLRLPSAVAIGVAAGLLADLGRRLHSLPAGVAAGALFAVLPSVSYYGAFARSYAFAAAAVVLSFHTLHVMQSRSAHVRYAAAVAAAGAGHLFAVLTLPAHLLLKPRGLAKRIAALAVGSVPAIALGLLGYGERHAISWIPQRGPEVWLKLPKMAAGDPIAGPLLFALAVAGAIVLFRKDRAWAGAVSCWLVLPPVLLLAVSHLLTPVYVDRYLFVTAPALALLAGIAAAAVSRYAVPVVLALTVALSWPQHAELRDVNGRFENIPWAVAKIRSRPADALVYGQSSLRTGFRYYARPADLPEDALLARPAPDPTGFGYPEKPDLAALDGRDQVWVVWRGGRSAGPRLPRVAQLARAGYRMTASWQSGDTPGLTVALFSR
ncbi:hypothetical protein [Thermoactinospora rubra]|uniref:hypothetical protein n=1 Tax=Thermoactinospora rubra TaxID=1088767 RepID=UPI001F0A40BE|nr:hypothetical protein [Thermoactinospora rubra]